MFALFSNGCTNKRATIPNLNLVKLRQDIEGRGVCSYRRSIQSGPSDFGLHPTLVQLPSTKVPNKGERPRLHLINIVVSSFLNPGPRPQGVLKVKPLLPCKAEDEVTPSQPTTREEEEEEEKEEEEDKREEEVVEVPNS